MKTLLEKLSKVKKEIGKISKDSTNPFYSSKYFDINSLLEHCEPLLEKNGLLLLQPISNGKVSTEIYEIETGEFMTSDMELPQLNDPQKIGSAITYYRRYTLQSLLGLQAEDDDGNKASGLTSNQSNGKGNANTPPKEADTRPWLDEKGYNYLMEQGTPEQIATAFKTRRMKKEYATNLKAK